MSQIAIAVRHSREKQPVPIVSDAAIMSVGVADGKLVPVLILDTSDRPDIEQLAIAHQHLDVSGDVTTGWVRQSWRNHRELRLLLHFVQPVNCVIVIAFDLHVYAGFVDQIVGAEALYIQPGRHGDRLKTTWDAPRVYVEVESESFRQIWERIFEREAARNLRRRGMSRRNVKGATADFIREWREFTRRRMGEYAADNRPGPPPNSS